MGRDNVIFFPPPRAGWPRATPARHTPFKFLSQDKIDICLWERRGTARGIGRVAIHENSGLSEEDADLALLYEQDGCWATWGLARCQDGIMLWRCCDGADLGLFSTVRQALTAVAGFGPAAASARPLLVWEA